MSVEISSVAAWDNLKQHVSVINENHLQNLIHDEERCSALFVESEGILFDFSRQRVTTETMELLFDLAEAAGLKNKIERMFGGEHINITEDRAVMHAALRAPKNHEFYVDGINVVADVHQVLDAIKDFSTRVRNGEFIGVTGKVLTQTVAIGIGGSYLGPEFVFEALKTDPRAKAEAEGRILRFLANVDPIDVARATENLDPETTLVVVVSKTFTTAETMLNARTLRKWLVDHLSALGFDQENIVAQHMTAVSAAVPKAMEFGINQENVFGFWDWVGGRYSVCSAVGVLPLSLQYGFDIVEEFLQGAHNIDMHFQHAPLRENIPVLMGMLGVWNSTFLGYPTRALLPYCQALHKFAPHIQQVDMESNGKRVGIDGSVLSFEAGEIDFGEPGTNGQHSFYQLIHQGRVIPCDFVGFRHSQNPIELEGEEVSNHDELMSNFFAQPDALAIGKSKEDLEKEGVPSELIPHKTFPGNRPSSSLLLDRLTPFTTGQLLSLYEHRTVVQGFIWGINSFDQWGVELGKILAKQVRTALSSSRAQSTAVSGFNPSTTRLLTKYLHSE